MKTSWRRVLLIVVGATIIVVLALMEPIAQDPLYHQFLDQRRIVGTPNFLNVVSNLPFLLVGSAGILFVVKNPGTVMPIMRPAWVIFFVGIVLTTFGSGYYHLWPANDSLIWDRLPMTIGFMSLVAIVCAEFCSPAIGRRLLLPLLAVGFASVIYWAYTEALGRGDLRPYIVVQFLPMLLVPMVLLMYRDKSDLGRYIWWMIGFYLVAKLAEFFDAEIYAAGNIISGHSLKHIIAALAPASLLYGLTLRRVDG